MLHNRCRIEICTFSRIRILTPVTSLMCGVVKFIYFSDDFARRLIWYRRAHSIQAHKALR